MNGQSWPWGHISLPPRAPARGAEGWQGGQARALPGPSRVGPPWVSGASRLSPPSCPLSWPPDAQEAAPSAGAQDSAPHLEKVPERAGRREGPTPRPTCCPRAARPRVSDPPRKPLVSFLVHKVSGACTPQKPKAEALWSTTQRPIPNTVPPLPPGPRNSLIQDNALTGPESNTEFPHTCILEKEPTGH